MPPGVVPELQEALSVLLGQQSVINLRAFRSGSLECPQLPNCYPYYMSTSHQVHVMARWGCQTNNGLFVHAVHACCSSCKPGHGSAETLFFRQFLRRSDSVGVQQAAVAGDRHLGDWLKGQPDVLMIRSKFVAKHAGDGRDDALRGIVLDMLKVSKYSPAAFI